MCELFGASMRRRTNLTEYLKEFFSHSSKHPHGWGLAFEKNGDIKIEKEPVCANESRILGSIIEAVPSQKVLLAHIRYATVGAKRTENCHPFSGCDNSGRHWALIHNGTIYSGMELLKYRCLQKGSTDSERIFMYLLDNINEVLEKKKDLNERERFEIVDRVIRILSPRNKLNLMIFDGEVLYVHKNMRGTLSYKQTGDGVLLSTQPLESEGWQDLPMCRTFAFKQGEKTFEGFSHGNEFISSMDSITALDAMNI